MRLETTFLVNAIVLAVIALALLLLLLLRFRHDRARAQAGDVLMDRLGEAFQTAHLVTGDDLAPLVERFEELQAGLRALESSIEELRELLTAGSGDPVALEHQILAESWKQFRKNADRSTALDDALRDRAWMHLLDQLTPAVPPDLRPSFDAALAPCREQRSILQRIELIPQIVAGTLARLPNDAEEIRRARELATLLSSAVDRVTEFRFKNWVTDSFLQFADLYLQRYQQARLERREAEMQDGLLLARQVLHAAAVEPIEVMPGETLFDGTRHVGRSTTNDPRFADGVITGVIRNGFVEDGQQIIRQPEVIVNRMR